MKIFKNQTFSRFAKKERLGDESLYEAIKKAEKGLIDADLGGGVIKQRIARPGEGKSGGYRTIILFRTGDKAFFVYGFAKNKRENLNEKELKNFRDLAKLVSSLSDAKINKAIEDGHFIRVKCDDSAENL